ALWQVMMDGGAGVLATREVRAADPAVLRALISLKPAMVIAGYLGLVAVAWLAGFEGDVKRVVAVLGVQSAGLATMIFGLSIFRGHEEFGTESIFLMIQRVLFGLLVAVVLLGGGGGLGVSVAGAASYALIAVAVFAWLGHRHDVRARLDADALRTHSRALLRSIGPLLLADGLAQLHMRSGQVILPFTSGLAEAGVYVVARRRGCGLRAGPRGPDRCARFDDDQRGPGPGADRGRAGACLRRLSGAGGGDEHYRDPRARSRTRGPGRRLGCALGRRCPLRR